MLGLYLDEIGIYTYLISDALPKEFIEYEKMALRKWAMLRHFVYKDVVKHLIPFILDAERESFYNFINVRFSEFFISCRCDWFDIQEKTLTLLVIHTDTKNLQELLLFSI